MMTYDQIKSIARHELTRLFSQYSIDAQDPGGMRAEMWGWVWRTGIKITYPDGEEWFPSTQHIKPGSANYLAAEEAEQDGCIIYTANDSLFLPYLIEQSKSEIVAHMATKVLTGKLIRQGSELPEELALWASRHLLEEAESPKAQGQSKYSNWIRDMCVTLAVDQLVSLGVSREPNGANDRKGAYEIVGEVMREEFDSPKRGYGLRTVADNYREYDKAMTGNKGWNPRGKTKK